MNNADFTRAFYIRVHTENWEQGDTSGPRDVAGFIRVERASLSPGRHLTYSWEGEAPDIYGTAESIRSVLELVLPRSSEARPTASVRGEACPVHSRDAYQLVLQRQAESLCGYSRRDIPVQEQPIVYNKGDAPPQWILDWWMDLADRFGREDEEQKQNDYDIRCEGGSQ